MSTTRIIIAILALSALVGCSGQRAQFTEETRKSWAMFAALEAAQSSAPFIGDFLRLFPDAEVTRRYFRAGDEPGFVVRADLHERYELTLWLPTNFDAERTNIVGYGEPHFQLLEIKKQEGLGRSYVGGTTQRTFGAAEWEKVVSQEGSFSVIGYTMITNAPAPGYAKRPKADY